MDTLRSTPPPPPATWDAILRTAAPLAIIGIFVLLFAVVLDLARTLLLPMVSAAVLAMMLGPLAAATKRWGFPSWLFAVVVVLLVLAALNAAIIHASALTIEWIGKAPAILASIKTRLLFLNEPFEALRNVQSAMLWGVLAFVLEFLPYIGPSIIAVMLFAAGLATFESLGQATLAPLFFLAMDTLEVYVVTPNIVGKRT